jgi:putative transposase
MIYPLVLDLAADGIPVTVTCRVLGFSTQAFNKWRRNPVSQRDWDNAHLINAAMDIHGDDPAFGYRFIADELADAGFTASERRVWRLCSEQRLWSVFAKKRGLNRKAGPPVHDDLVGRDFSAECRDQLWLTDITEHRSCRGQALLLRHQRRLLQPHRRLLARRPDDRIAGRFRPPQCHRTPPAGGNHRGPFGQRPPTLGDPRGAPVGYRHLDRADLSPEA